MSESARRQYSTNTIRKFNRCLKNSLEIDIPSVFKDAIHFLKKDENIKTKGILCNSAPIHRINRVREMYKNGCRPKYKNVHVAANILKQYLNKLRPPLLTYEFNYKFKLKFLSILNTLFDEKFSPHEGNTRITPENILVNAKLTFEGSEFLAYITRSLPMLHRINLRFLMKFLATVNAEPENEMNAHQLATIFAPLIIKEKPNCELSAEFEDERIVVVKHLIENCDQFWI